MLSSTIKLCTDNNVDCGGRREAPKGVAQPIGYRLFILTDVVGCRGSRRIIMDFSPSGSLHETTPRLHPRRWRLLALLNALGGNAGNRDFQKLLFLYCEELLATSQAGSPRAPYEFVPYLYGAFSFTSYADRRHLISRGLLVNDDQHWILSEEGKRIAGEIQDRSMDAFSHRYRGIRGDMLIAETYRRYPYYATRSEIAEEILQDDEITLGRIRAARPERNTASLLTIGYEGRTLENFLNALLGLGVTVICDVRRNAISRKYGFSKSALAKACNGIDIRYKHMPELGIESWQRRSLELQSDYEALFAEYESKTLPNQGEALEKIRAWLQSGECVALTCYEREVIQCHRRCVSAALERLPAAPGRSELSERTGQPHTIYSVTHL